MQVSVGIGLTNDCNLSCAHCYRPQGGLYELSLEDIQAVCNRLDITSFNMGTGESWLHSQFPEIVEYLGDRAIKMSMASNGYSLTVMPSALLRQFHDVEVSIDFASQKGQDSFRGAGNWACVMSAIDRCQSLGVEITILATLMNTNYDQMDGLVGVAADTGANLRVNVYQPVGQDDFFLTYDQFWDGFRRLLDAGRLLSTSEPIVNAMLGLDTLRGSPGGRKSIRISPRRNIIPCVYWPTPDLTLADLEGMDGPAAEEILESEQFRRSRFVPETCRDCQHVSSCGGGCASRRALLGDLNQPDIYCPLFHGRAVDLSFTPAPKKDLPRGQNVCTTIVVP